jgi:hypothetical protein
VLVTYATRRTPSQAIDHEAHEAHEGHEERKKPSSCGVVGDFGEDRGMCLVETVIGTIAPDWKVVPLKDVAEKPQYGLTAKAAQSGDIKFLRITDITERGVNWTTVPSQRTPKTNRNRPRPRKLGG